MLGFVYSKPIATPEPKPKNPFSIVWLFLGIIFLTFLVYFSYEKSVRKNENKHVVDISEAQKEKFRADSLKLTNCVQYVLRAKINGFYERCDGKGKVFLLQGEVYKYGSTCEVNSKDRYVKSFYEENKVEMFPQFYGNLFECQVEEKRKLYQYPALPENVKRPENERLILPVGNCKVQ